MKLTLRSFACGLALTICISITLSFAKAEQYESDLVAIQAAGVEFSNIGIEQSISDLPAGFVREDDIVAGPDVRMPLFLKLYEDKDYIYAFVGAASYEGTVAMKIFQIIQKDKTHCMNTTVKTVEHLQASGLKGWKKHWRQDYQVAHWKAVAGKYRFSVTCRMKEGIWMLEETRGLASIQAQ